MKEHNLPNEKGRNKFEIYKGSIKTQMPRIIADGRTPMSCSELMLRRLDLRDNESEVRKFYMNRSFITGDAIIYHPNRKIKIICDSQTLRDLNSESSTFEHFLNEEDYDKLEGEEFERNEMKLYDWMSREEIRRHPIWKALAKDQKLLDDYTYLAFTENKQKNRKIGMGIYPENYYGNKPLMNVLIMGPLMGNVRSISFGSHGAEANLVGIAHNIKSQTYQEIQKAKQQLKNLKDIVGTKKLDKLDSLIKKL